jgi:14-3-3 protein epsilon
VCDDLIGLVDAHLLPHAQGPETRIFYHKMKGDYFRYLAEFLVGDKLKV